MISSTQRRLPLPVARYYLNLSGRPILTQMEPLVTHLAAGKLVQDGQVMRLKGHLQSKMLLMVVIVILSQISSCASMFSGLERRQREGYLQHFRQNLTTRSP